MNPKIPFITISSHNEELDAKIGGGLPLGSLTLVEGGSGTGKSILTQQMLYGALLDGVSCSVFTSESTPSRMINQMKKLDLDILDFLLLKKARIYPMSLTQLGADTMTTLLDAIQQECNRGLIIVDSLTSALNPSIDNSAILRFFEECQRLCATGTSIMVTLHAQGMSDDLLNPIRALCDANLKLKAEQDGQRLVKTLEVTKVRGADSVTGAIVGFEVEPGWGMRVIPISKARG
jgi:flagellar protein FlaH